MLLRPRSILAAVCSLLPLALGNGSCGEDEPQRLSPSGSSDAPAPAEQASPPPRSDALVVNVGANVSPDPGVELGGGVSVFPSRLEPSGKATIRYRGGLAGSPNLTLHYGFNGWNRAEDGQLSADDGTGNLDFYRDVPMDRATADAPWEATLDIPAGARALHFVVFTSLGSQKTWDNNRHLDWNRGISMPFIGPLLSFGEGDPSSSVVVTFHTGHACIGTVEYGTTPAFGCARSDPSPVTAHELPLDELSADTPIYYRVGCSDAERSEIHAFRTASASPAAFEFVVLGDAQYTGESGRWPDIAREVAEQHGGAAFLLFAGDMTWNDHPGLWWTFFDAARSLFASHVLMAAPGNHDTPTVNSNPDTTSFERWLAHPRSSGSETWYRFRYGDALFLGLSSERPEGFIAGSGEQWLFAQDSLSTAGAPALWSFAYWHIAPYDAGARHAGEQGAFRDITALFDGKIDFAFSGHEHLYQRMKPLRYNAVLAPSGVYGNGPGDGVGYMLVPPAGASPEHALISRSAPTARYRARLAVPASPSSSDWVPSENGFAVVKIEGKAIGIQVIGMGNHETILPAHLTDQISYTKP